jgi:hypothetical protein
MWTSAAFVAVAIVHLLPIGPVFAPAALTRLYGIAPEDTTLLVMLRHRAALLALVGVLCVWAAFAPSIRPAALTAASINIVTFLGFYAAYGASAGALRVIALVDLLAIAPLAVAAWGTFSRA